MQRLDQSPQHTMRYAAKSGAKVGVALDLGYAMAFLAYASVRSTLTILAAGGMDGGMLGTIVATTASIAWVSLLVAILFAPIAALIGMVTAVIVNALLGRVNPIHSATRALIIGLVTAAGIALLFYAALVFGMGVAVSPEAIEMFAFWLGLPTLIYIAAGGVGSLELNRELVRSPAV